MPVYVYADEDNNSSSRISFKLVIKNELSIILENCKRKYFGYHETRDYERVALRNELKDALGIEFPQEFFRNKNAEDRHKYKAHLTRIEGFISEATDSFKTKELRGQNFLTFDNKTISLAKWRQEKFLSLHLYFLVIIYLEIQIGKLEYDLPAERNIFLAALLDEIWTTANAYLIRKAYQTIIEQKNVDKSQLSFFAENFFAFMEELAPTMQNGDEIRFPCGTNEHAIYVVFTRYFDVLLVRIDNLGMGIEFAHFVNGATNLSQKFDSTSAEKGVVPTITSEIKIKEIANYKSQIVSYIMQLCINVTKDNVEALSYIYSTDHLPKPPLYNFGYPALDPQFKNTCVTEGFLVGTRYRFWFLDKTTYHQAFEWLKERILSYVELEPVERDQTPFDKQLEERKFREFSIKQPEKKKFPLPLADDSEAIELTLYKIGIEKIGEAIEDALILAEDLPESVYKNQFLVFMDNYKKTWAALQQKISKAQPKKMFLDSIKQAAADLHLTLQQKLRSLNNSTQSDQEVIMLTPILEEVVNVFAFVVSKPVPKPTVNNDPPEILQTKKWVMQACFEATASKLAPIFNQQPSIFISYSWTNPIIVQLVRRIAEDLKRSGPYLFLDVWQNTLGTSSSAFIEKIANEKEVTGIMLMGSPDLVEKYLGTDNAFKLEQDLIFARYRNNASCVIPVLISGKPREAFPGFLGGGVTRVFTGFLDQDIYDLSVEEQYYENLCRIIIRLAAMTFPGERFAKQQKQIQLLLQDFLEKIQFIKANQLSNEALMQLYTKYQQEIRLEMKILSEQIIKEGNAYTPVMFERIQTQKLIDNNPLPTWSQDFVGRNKELYGASDHKGENMSIKERLQKTSILLIKGFTGAGKTRLSMEYGRLFASDYVIIYYFDAKQSITSQYKALATDIVKKLGQNFDLEAGDEQIEDEVKSFLSEIDNNWLLVFDDATNIQQLEKHLPKIDSQQNYLKHILITSTSNKFGNVRWLDLGMLEESEAISLLWKNHYLDEIVAGSKPTEPDNAYIKSAINLVKALGCLPLAIKQSGAYLRENKNKTLQSYYKDYIELLKKRNNAPSAHPETILSAVQNIITNVYSNMSLTKDAFVRATDFEGGVLNATIYEKPTKDQVDSMNKIIDKESGFNEELNFYSNLKLGEVSTLIGGATKSHKHTLTMGSSDAKPVYKEEIKLNENLLQVNQQVIESNNMFNQIMGQNWQNVVLINAIVTEDESVFLPIIHELDADELEARDANGNTGLHAAVLKDNVSAIEAYIEKGQIDDEPNKFGLTALHLAVIANNADNVVRLLNSNASATVCSQWQFPLVEKGLVKLSALTLAILFGRDQAIKAIYRELKEQRKLNDEKLVWCNEIGNVLHVAVVSCVPHTLELLLTDPELNHWAKEFLEKPNAEGETPLAYAAKQGLLPAIDWLVKAGANINAQNNVNNRTALHYAVLGAQPKAVHNLIQLGANVNLSSKEDGKGKIPLQLARKLEKDKSRENQKNRFNTIIKNLSNEGTTKAQSQGLGTTVKLIRRNLVIQGGGAKGLAYIGAIAVLEEEQMLKDLYRVGGTSAGAITALCLALNFSAKEIEEALIHLTVKDLLGDYGQRLFAAKASIKTWLEEMQKNLNDPRWMKETEGGGQALLGAPGHLPDLFEILKLSFILPADTSVSDGKALENWLKALIKNKLKRDLANKGYDKDFVINCLANLTFGRLGELVEHKLGYKHLYVFATDITDKKIVDFNSEDGRWNSINVIEAVCASAALPGAFSPRNIKVPNAQDSQLSEAHFFVDGGLVRNKPVDYFDEMKFHNPHMDHRWRGQRMTSGQTLGLCLEEGKGPSLESLWDDVTVLRQEIDHIGGADLIKRLWKIFYNAKNLIQEMQHDINDRTITIYVQDLKTTEFDAIEDPTRLAEIRAWGRGPTEAFLKRGPSQRGSSNNNATNTFTKMQNAFNAHPFKPNESQRNAPVEKMTNDYWYNETDINRLLKIKLVDNQEAYIMAAQFPLLEESRGEAAQLFKDTLLTGLKKTRDTGIPSLFPVNLIKNATLDEHGLPLDRRLHGNHWVLLVIKYNKAIDTLEMNYLDPLGNDQANDINVTEKDLSTLDNYGERWKDHITSIVGLIAGACYNTSFKPNIMVTSLVQQDNGFDCGPLLIANAVAEVSNSRRKKVDTRLLRKEHASLLQSQQTTFISNENSNKKNDSTTDVSRLGQQLSNTLKNNTNNSVNEGSSINSVVNNSNNYAPN